MITRALGTQSRVTPDIFDLEADPGDLFLLCTDGLTREVPDAGLAAILSGSQTLAEMCNELVSTANQAGGGDNITCLLVRVTE